MNRCSECGSTTEHEIAVCADCGKVYSGRKLLEMRQLEFLIDRVSEWREAGWVDLPKEVIDRYARRLRELQKIYGLRHEPALELVPEPAPSGPVSSLPLEAPPERPEAIVSPVPVPEPELVQSATPNPDPVPFDEWLLSERNIKIALYAGASLLLAAGIIFIASKWGELGGPFKFASTLMATGLLLVGGFVLHQHRGLRLGGRAVLTVASGFLPLNFAVLQIYILGPSGFRDDAMWLISSPSCLVVYALLAHSTRFSLFTYIGVGALYSALMAALEVAGLSWHPVVPLIYSMLALVLLLTARRVQNTTMADLCAMPFTIIAHATAPLSALASLAWLSAVPSHGPWWGAAGGFIGVLFYVASEVILDWRATRWAAVTLVSLTFGLALSRAVPGDAVLGAGLLLLALVYQGAGHLIERWEKRFEGALSLYSNAYTIVALVTALATRSTSEVTLALFGDVVILMAGAFIHGRPEFAYATTWLFMLPGYLVLIQTLSSVPSQAIPMGALGLCYAAAGYVFGRQEVAEGSLPRRGGPFLTAAVFLSAVVVLLAWGDPVLSTAVLVGAGGLYLAGSLWLGWPSFLFPALVAMNVSFLTVARALFGYDFVESLPHYGTPMWRAMDAVYAILALGLMLGALALRRMRRGAWAGPLYVVGAIDMAISNGAALLDWPVAIALSAVNAALLLALAWLEDAEVDLGGLKRIPILSYLGLGLVVLGHFYAMGAAGLLHDWPIHSSALLALFVLVSWRLERGDLAAVYGAPLRWVGLGLGALPATGALLGGRPVLIAVTFAIIGLTYVGEAIRRHSWYLGYMACAALLVLYWAVLHYFSVTEPQVYVIPLGLALLAVGWTERRQGRLLLSGAVTLGGLGLLLGSSFIQSLPRGAGLPGLFLGIESLSAIGWGVWTRSRNYVAVGMLALVSSGVAQFGAGFTELPRWVQLSLTGSLLLGGGIGVLVKREQLLKARQVLTEEWSRWER